jgi:hypothetical protein
MKIVQFTASEVEYNEAIDGEIVQIIFDEDPDQDPFNRKKRFVLISHSYEFPGKPTVEWHDGECDDGGAEIKSYKLTSKDFVLKTNAGVMFKVQHHGHNEVLRKIKAFFQREYG